MAKVSRRFVNETLWPEYAQLSDVLRRHLDEVTGRIIAAAICTYGVTVRIVLHKRPLPDS